MFDGHGYLLQCSFPNEAVSISLSDSTTFQLYVNTVRSDKFNKFDYNVLCILAHDINMFQTVANMNVLQIVQRLKLIHWVGFQLRYMYS